jgi:hypothetical protein
MSYLSVQQLRSLFEALCSQYESLSDNKSKLEASCAKLRECIDVQVQQIQSLNTEFEKLRQDFMQRRGERVARMPVDPPPPAPLAQSPPDEPADQDWELESFPASEKLDPPLVISLLAEILDVSVICSTAFSPDGSWLAVGSDKTLRIYDIDKDDFLLQHSLDDCPQKSTNHIRSIAWTRDSLRLICGGEDGKVRTFSVADAKLRSVTDVGVGEVFQVCIANREDFFAAVSGDGLLSLFRISDSGPIARLKRDRDSTLVATSVAISTNDRLIAVGYGDYNVALWDSRTHHLLSSTCCHSSGVYAVRFIPHQDRLVTGSLDSTIKIWTILPGHVLELQRTLEGHSSYVLSLAIDPTGEFLVSGSKDLTARVSSVSSGALLYSIKAHSNSVITVAFSPAGDRFCTGSGDHSVKIWTLTREFND